MLTIEKALLLKSVGIFSGVSDDLLLNLTSRLLLIELSQGQDLFDIGDLVSSVYIINEGQIVIHEHGRIHATLEKGAVIGEMAVLCGKIYSSTATASKETQLYSINQETLFRIMSEDNVLMKNIFNYICNNRLGKF